MDDCSHVYTCPHYPKCCPHYPKRKRPGGRAMHEKEQEESHSHHWLTQDGYCMCVCKQCLNREGPFCICPECECNK